MKEFVYLNGKFVEAGDASVSVFDRGLNYGDGLFETMKAREGKPLLLKEHARRLKAGARALRFALPPLKAFLDDIDKGALETLLRKNRLMEGEAYLKLIVTRGADKGGHLPSKGPKPTTIIVAKKLDEEYLWGLRKAGVAAVFVEGLCPALPGVKSLNYLPSVMAKMEAAKNAAFEALFTTGGFVTEGSSSNVFAVNGGHLTTPPLASGALPGIMRGEVIRLAKKWGFPAIEAPLSTKALEQAEEAFLTNSIMEAVPLVRIGKKKIAGGRPGSLTKAVQLLLRPL